MPYLVSPGSCDLPSTHRAQPAVNTTPEYSVQIALTGLSALAAEDVPRVPATGA